MRKAMGLMQSIMIMLLVSGMMLIVLKYASISAQHSFVREQSELFLNSAIEQALLAISFNNRGDNGCLESFTPHDVKKRGIRYTAHINITKYYLQKGSDDLANCNIGVAISSDSDSEGMALFEVEVNATKDDGTLASRIIRRTLQQP